MILDIFEYNLLIIKHRWVALAVDIINQLSIFESWHSTGEAFLTAPSNITSVTMNLNWKFWVKYLNKCVRCTYKDSRDRHSWEIYLVLSRKNIKKVDIHHYSTKMLVWKKQEIYMTPINQWQRSSSKKHGTDNTKNIKIKLRRSLNLKISLKYKNGNKIWNNMIFWHISPFSNMCTMTIGKPTSKRAKVSQNMSELLNPSSSSPSLIRKTKWVISGMVTEKQIPTCSSSKHIQRIWSNF